MITDKGDAYIRNYISDQILQLITTGRLFNNDSDDNQRRSKGDGRTTIKPIKTFRLIMLFKAIFDAKLSSLGRTHMKRDIYYSLKFMFDNEYQMDHLLISLCQQLQCPRHCLAIYSCCKGVCIGPIEFRASEDNSWTSCHQSEKSIPNRAVHLDYDIRVTPGFKPNFIFIVEKYCIFQQIAQVMYPTQYSFIMVTGKGAPDLASRAWVKVLKKQLNIPIFGLCDLNPFGCKLMASHLLPPLGSLAWPEGERFLVQQLDLIAFTSKDLDELTNISLQRLSELDKKVLNGLLTRFKAIQQETKENFTIHESFIKVLVLMKSKQRKLEIEALGADYFITEWLPTHLRTLQLQTKTYTTVKRFKKTKHAVTNIYGIKIW